MLLLIGGAACGQPVAFAAGLLLAHTRELLHPTRQGLRAAFFSLAVMPLKAVCLLDAAVRTLWRMGVSHKHLLEWTTSAQAEQQRGARLLPLGRMAR